MVRRLKKDKILKEIGNFLSLYLKDGGLSF